MTQYSLIFKGTGTGTRILVVQASGGWSLPSHSHSSTPVRNADLETTFRTGITTLECLYDDSEGPEDENPSRIYLQETHGPVPADLPGTRWIGLPDLADLPLAVPAHRPVLGNWLSEAVSGCVPDSRLPWARPGWFAAASAWAVSCIEAAGISVTGSAKQVSTSLWSTVMSIPAAAGLVYFKAPARPFWHEPGLTELLSRQFPDNIPRVLATDDQLHYLLMHDFGDVPDPDGPSAILQAYLKVLPLYARMQRQCAAQVSGLAAMGCPRYRLAELPDLYDEVLADEPRLCLDSKAGLSHAECDRLRSFSPVFRRICADLDSAGLPDTVVHGDLFWENFSFARSDPLIFDWGDSALAHPFISLFVPLWYINDCLPGDQEALDAVTDAYLAEWADVGPVTWLRELARLAAFPACLWRTLVWRATVADIENDRQCVYRYAVPANLRNFFPLMERYYPDSHRAAGFAS